MLWLNTHTATRNWGSNPRSAMYWLSNLKHVSLLLHTSVSLLWNGCNNTQVCSFPIAAQPVTTISHFCKHKCTISRLLWVRRHILVPTYTTLSFARLRSRCQCGTSMFGVLTSERSVSKVLWVISLWRYDWGFQSVVFCYSRGHSRLLEYIWTL